MVRQMFVLLYCCFHNILIFKRAMSKFKLEHFSKQLSICLKIPS